MKRYANWQNSIAAIVLVFLVSASALAGDSIRLPDYQQVELDNGITLILLEKSDVPLVSFSAAVRGGLVSEPADKNGVASLVAELLQKGAGERDAVQFAEAVAAVGGRFNVSANSEFIGLNGEFMSRDSDLMISLLADVLLRPRMDEAEFQKIKTRAIQGIAAMKDADARGLIGTYAEAFVFGEHPYARSSTGSEASLARVSYEDAKKYAASNLVADRLLLVVAGDFKAKAMRKRIEKALGGWKAAGTAIAPLEAAPRVPGGRVLLVDKPGATQTYFWIGNVGVSRSDPDAVAIELVNTLFGGRFTSMLNTALRIESGLTYGARSNLAMRSQPGSVSIASYTATETTVEAVDLALEQLRKVREAGFDAAALQSGKAYRQGTYPMGFETASDLAGQILTLKFYGLPDSKVNDYSSEMDAVTSEKANQVIARIYPPREEMVFVFIGDSQKIKDLVGVYGEITMMSITDSDWVPGDK